MRSIVLEKSRAAPERPVGLPKEGLRVVIRTRGQAMTLRGRADPMLLYLVIGAILALGLAGVVTVSPAQGLIGSFAVALLFSPFLAFLVFATLRLRSECIIDREQGLIDVNERSFFRRLRRTMKLGESAEVMIVCRSQLPVVGGPATYSIYVVANGEPYLAMAGHDEASQLDHARQVALFLGAPLQKIGLGDDKERAGMSWRHLAVTLALYVAPIAVCIAIITVAIGDVPAQERLMVALVSAILLSQIGAILAYGYARSRGAQL